ncbi:Piso0_002005 [Millerozyma farinosa CBS 7064]|uniref:GTPase-activating protein GYP5 n=1 Tax=Pichia sorbitophila (strain ATCC MYA-4447 / BCRC 22081 / CBS 7064 / NBRC 10061 / NRRL Y-12695) TaxID=559304 RepID=G8YBF6_PICSO|nr:Piso0_002005 [Millerozyma farinosa CBS 7064]
MSTNEEVFHDSSSVVINTEAKPAQNQNGSSPAKKKNRKRKNKNKQPTGAEVHNKSGNTPYDSNTEASESKTDVSVNNDRPSEISSVSESNTNIPISVDEKQDAKKKMTDNDDTEFHEAGYNGEDNTATNTPTTFQSPREFKDADADHDEIDSPSKIDNSSTTVNEEASIEDYKIRSKASTNGSPELPNRKSISDCLLMDQSYAHLINTSSATSAELEEISRSYRKESSNFLLESKFKQLNKRYESRDSKFKESILNGTENVKRTFNDIKETVGGVSGMLGYEIDWEFWTRVVNDYEDVLQNDLDQLNDYISKGIPKEVRGIVWQVISRSKNFQLEEFYYQLKSEPSIHEKSIRRDLTRTSFYTNVQQANKSEELFNVIKAYSLFDPDVGYTQGMIFITVPLIMNMNESECFSLLVTLMKEYNLRDLFCPEMKGLHLILYEFDRLVEVNLPNLYNHLVKQGIKSSMYASQWFLTFFAYKFPLDMVLRIYDIIITQGAESLLKFAVNLMLRNEKNLLPLKFDKLLDYLKNNLFNFYVNENNKTSTGESNDLSRRASVSKRFSMLGAKRASGNNALANIPNYYKLDQLVNDSMQINVEPVDLTRFENEFESIYINEKSRIKEIDMIRVENGKLRHEIKELEKEYTGINSDHIDMVQKMVNVKVSLPEIVNDNEELKKSINALTRDIEELESKTNARGVESASPGSNVSTKSITLPANVENDIQELLAINAKETERSVNLEEELYNLQQEEMRLDTELHQAKNLKSWFFGKWK